MAWNGVRWLPDRKGTLVMQAARGVSRWYAQQAALLSCRASSASTPPAVRRDLLAQAELYAAWAIKCETERALQAVARLAASEPELVCSLDQFDADPFLLNCQNGTLDLRGSSPAFPGSTPPVLHPHRREDLLTKLAPVDYSPDALGSFPRFDAMLEYMTDGDRDLASFLQVAFGYSLSGDTREDKLFVVHGKGGSGKSTLLEAVKAALGDYAKTADFETFIKRKGDMGGPRNDIADLAGARLVLSIEVEEGKTMAESVVKSLTGGDTIKARHLYADLFEFRPQLKLWLVCNDKPRVRENDTGIWRRIVVIPLDKVVPPERKDPSLKVALREDPAARAAILAWAVQGCQAWLRNGLRVPRAAEQASFAYRADMDVLRPFLTDCCVVSPDARVPVADLRAAYDRWCTENGQKHSLGPRSFNEAIERKGCERKTSKWAGKDIKTWLGIGLIAETQESQEQGATGSNRISKDPPKNEDLWKVSENAVSTGCPPLVQDQDQDHGHNHGYVDPAAEAIRQQVMAESGQPEERDDE